MTETSPRPDAALPDPWFESEDRRFRLYQGDCLDLLPRIPDESVDVVFADPPYFLSNDGITCHAGRMVSVNKGRWDKSQGPLQDHEFCLQWLAECRRIVKPTGSVWVSGTMHVIHSVGFAMQRLGYKLLNDITWVKPNPPPNLSCRYFTHATETVLWARKSEKARHTFNYHLMKALNGGKQMKSVWEIGAPPKDEKVFGKHPTQKPVALLERIIAASSDENQLILDPFSGSGTTGIAAAKAGRLFVGMDTDTGFLAMATLRYVGAPQADRPERILALVRASCASGTSVGTLSSQLAISPRQVHYYRQAAALLGFMSHEYGCWHVTNSGRAISRAPPREARSLVAHAISVSPLVRLAQRATRTERDGHARQRAVADALGRATALSAATCMRRARTLLSWLEWLTRYRESGQTFLFGDVAPVSQESDDAPVA
ncbi:MAG: DNA methyltransferase [Phycisphaerae bacterium]